MFAIKTNTIPKSVWLILTTDCNNRCVWCYAGESAVKNMPLDDCYRYIDLCKDIGVKRIILIGGEPTVYPDIIKVVEKISHTEIQIGIITNGRKLADENFAKELGKFKTSVTISLEGSGREQHDLTTCVKGSYDEVIRGMENCRKYGINFSTITTISEINKDNLNEMVDFCEGMGKKRLTFNYCGPTISNPKSNLVLRPKEIAEKVQEVYKYAKDRGIKTKFSTSTAKCLIKKEILEDMIITGAISKSRACQVYGGEGMAINYDGSILPCTHWMGMDLGNIKKDNLLNPLNFKEYWAKGKPFQLRQTLIKYPSKKCSKCEIWGECIGGCPMFWLKFKPEDEINERTARWN